MKKNKRGLSGVVTALLLVLLSVVLVGIVWSVMQNLVEEELPEQGCINAFEKVTLDYGLTCFLRNTNETQFSINVGDISINKIVLTFSGDGSAKSIEIKNIAAVINGIRPYGGDYTNSVKIPGKNAGLTYAFNYTAEGFTNPPISIKVTPIIGDTQCETSDQITEIEPCPLP